METTEYTNKLTKVIFWKKIIPVTGKQLYEAV